MKYLKTFEGFSINENEGASAVEAEVAKKIEELSPEEQEKLKGELVEFADRLGLDPSELADKEKVESALQAQGDITLESLGVNEGISEWWGRVKSKISALLTGLGLTGIVGGIITTAIGSSFQETATTLADYRPDAIVEPNQAVIIGGIAAAVGVASLITGLSMSGDLGSAGSAAGGARRL